jgi:type II secretory pathway predicted ATPase ExeA/outer membrane protein OmpA-like peptidoglycan-associated protein
MYESFFELREKPFSLLPDPGFIYLSPKHREGLTILEYGLVGQAGFTVLTGEIGVGKTTLMRSLLGRLDERFSIGLISHTNQSLGDLMEWVCASFGLRPPGEGAVDYYQTFVDFVVAQYAKGKRTLLVVDEAQNLGQDKLEQLRLLSNINSDKDLVLQLMLLGQPQLRDLLRRAELQQFVQRVAASYHLGQLDAADTEHYIRHRIAVAGGRREIFTKEACEAVFEYSNGVPRLINLICDTAMVYAYAAKSLEVTGEIVDEFVDAQAAHLLVPLDRDVTARERRRARASARQSPLDATAVGKEEHAPSPDSPGAEPSDADLIAGAGLTGAEGLGGKAEASSRSSQNARLRQRDEVDKVSPEETASAVSGRDPAEQTAGIVDGRPGEGSPGTRSARPLPQAKNGPGSTRAPLPARDELDVAPVTARGSAGSAQSADSDVTGNASSGGASARTRIGSVFRQSVVFAILGLLVAGLVASSKSELGASVRGGLARVFAPASVHSTDTQGAKDDSGRVGEARQTSSASQDSAAVLDQASPAQRDAVNKAEPPLAAAGDTATREQTRAVLDDPAGTSEPHADSDDEAPPAPVLVPVRGSPADADPTERDPRTSPPEQEEDVGRTLPSVGAVSNPAATPAASQPIDDSSAQGTPAGRLVSRVNAAIGESTPDGEVSAESSLSMASPTPPIPGRRHLTHSVYVAESVGSSTSAIGPPDVVGSASPERSNGVAAIASIPAYPPIGQAPSSSSRLDYLAQELRGIGITVDQIEPGRLDADLGDKVQFAIGDTTLDPPARAFLEMFAEILQDAPPLQILVIGHTDQQGRSDVNQRLSVRRAEAVVQFLASVGVSPLSELRFDGRGEEEPKVDPVDEWTLGYSANRRIELKIALLGTE